MELGELLYRIGADATDFIKTIEDMDKRMQNLEKAMKEHLKFDDFGSGITEGAKGVNDAFDGMADSAQEAGDSFDGMGDSAQEAGDSVGNAFDGGQNAVQKFVQSLIQAIPPFDEIKNKAVDFAKAVDAAFSKAAESAGTLTQKLGSGLTGVGQKLTNYVTKPAIGATTALVGMAAWGGLKGLESLDQAQARLRGLGYEGKELSGIMGQVAEAVKGTTFWTHDMADVAAKALQGGAKMGAELESRLNAVSAATAASGAELSHMGQILNRVGAAGKVTLGDLTQLSDNGVEAAQVLGDEFGKTAEEIREMASAGQITADMLEQALGNQLGGVAMEMATTFGEVFQILQGQVSRLGQAFWTAGQTMDGSFDTQAGAFAKLKVLMNEVYEDLTKLEEVAGRWGAKFETAIDGVIGAYRGLKKWVSGASEDQLRMAKDIGAVVLAAGPLLKVFGGILTAAGGLAVSIATVTAGFKILGMGALGAVGSFGVLAGAVGLIGGALGLLPDSMKDAITAMNAAAQRALPQVFETIKSEITEKLPQAIHEGLAMMADTFNTLEVAVDGVGEIARSIIQSITEAFQEDDGQWVDAAGSLITSLAGAIVSVGGALIELGATLISEFARGMAENPGAIEDLAMSIVESLKMAFMGIGDALGGLMDTIVDGLMGDGMGLDSFLELANEIIANIGMALAEQGPELLTAGFEILANLIQGIIEALPSILDTALNILIYLVTALEANIGAILAGGIKILVGIINGIISAIPQLAGTAMRLITFLVTSIIAMIPRLFATGVQLLLAIIEGIVSIVGNLISTATSAVNDFRAKFTSVDWASLGRSIISGIVSGVRAAASSLARAAVSAAKGALDKAKSFLGINSPSRLFEKEIGYSIPEGSALGVDKKAKLLVDSAVSMAKNAYEHGKGSVADGVRAMQKEADKLDLPNYEVQALFKSHGIDLSSLFENEKELDYQQEQKEKYNIQLWEEVVYLLGKLLDKNTDIYMNDRKVGETVRPVINALNQREDELRSRRRGVRLV